MNRKILGALTIAVLFAAIGFSCGRYSAVDKCLKGGGQWSPSGYCTGIEKGR